MATRKGSKPGQIVHFALRSESRHVDDRISYFSGFGNKLVAFLHKASRTLIVADLIFSLPGTEQYSKSSQSANRPFFAPNFEPFSSMHKEFTVGSGIDKEAMRRDAHTVAQWDFDRIIPCHGDVIETGGKEAWLSAYGAYFT
ncbi:hypothetical protein AcW1_001863 [Taiwanofungus camphoratus]|nr:hypothetical protein AcW1_001863 [Antrodia cinnamomea]